MLQRCGRTQGTQLRGGRRTPCSSSPARLAHLGRAPFAPSFSPSSYSSFSATLYSSSSFSPPSPYSSYSLGTRSQVYITPPTTRWRPLAEARTPNPRRYGYVART